MRSQVVWCTPRSRGTSSLLPMEPPEKKKKEKKTFEASGLFPSSQSQMMVVDEIKLPEGRTLSVLFSIVSNDAVPGM